jgi:hypothetical protein
VSETPEPLSGWFRVTGARTWLLVASGSRDHVEAAVRERCHGHRSSDVYIRAASRGDPNCDRQDGY